MDLIFGAHTVSDNIAEVILTAILQNDESYEDAESMLHAAKDDAISAYANVGSDLIKIERQNSLYRAQLRLEFDIQGLRKEYGSRREAQRFLTNYLWKRIPKSVYTAMVSGE